MHLRLCVMSLVSCKMTHSLFMTCCGALAAPERLADGSGRQQQPGTRHRIGGEAAKSDGLPQAAALAALPKWRLSSLQDGLQSQGLIPHVMLRMPPLYRLTLGYKHLSATYTSRLRTVLAKVDAAMSRLSARELARMWGHTVCTGLDAFAEEGRDVTCMPPPPPPPSPSPPLLSHSTNRACIDARLTLLCSALSSDLHVD